MVLALLCSTLCAALDAGVPIVVPLGESSWNGFQVLGLTSSLAAVREVTAADVEEGEYCRNPGMRAVLRGRTGTEAVDAVEPSAMGVTLHTWKLPPPGGSSLARGDSALIYRSGSVKEGCTAEPAAQAALQDMKTRFADAGVDLTRPPPAHVDLFTTLNDPRDFSGYCYSSKRRCTTRRTATLAGAPLELVLELSARSLDHTELGDEPEPGSQIERHYRGTIKYRGTVTSFDFVLEPPGGNPSHVLTAASAIDDDGTTVVLLYTSWCYLSCRERVPLLVRLR